MSAIKYTDYPPHDVLKREAWGLSHIETSGMEFVEFRFPAMYKFRLLQMAAFHGYNVVDGTPTTFSGDGKAETLFPYEPGVTFVIEKATKKGRELAQRGRAKPAAVLSELFD